MHIRACAGRRELANEPCSPFDKPHLLPSISHPGSVLAQPAPRARVGPRCGRNGSVRSPILSSCCGQALRSQQATPCLVHHQGLFEFTVASSLLFLEGCFSQGGPPQLSPPPPAAPSGLLLPGDLSTQKPNYFDMEPCGPCLNFPRDCCLVNTKTVGGGGGEGEAVSGLFLARSLEPCKVPDTWRILKKQLLTVWMDRWTNEWVNE